MTSFQPKAKFRITIQLVTSERFPPDIVDAVVTHVLTNFSASMEVTGVKVSAMDLTDQSNLD